MNNANAPAFPRADAVDALSFEIEYSSTGLTKREYIAALCLQGTISTGSVWPSYLDADEMARRSVRFADALLAELAK